MIGPERHPAGVGHSFVVDMNAPGVDVRPLRELTGLEMFNEVFLDGVFVPDDQVIGEVDGGWPLARTTLANERVSMGSGSSFGGGVEQLVALVADALGMERVFVHPLAGVLSAYGMGLAGTRPADPRGGPVAARPRRRDHHAGPGRPVDVRLPRQPLPHHRRRHQRDPTQRDRRAPPRPPPRSGTRRRRRTTHPTRLTPLNDRPR